MPSTEHAPLRLPSFLRKNRGGFHERGELTSRLRAGSLHTVCEEARCPNIGECFSSGTATFMILGDTCTRRCHFCAVKTGRPLAPSDDEPSEVARAARDMGLRHVVITSVDRDDLTDLGASHWAKTVRAVKGAVPTATVEILTPDFKGRAELIDVVLAAEPDVFNHNTESVRRLYKRVRPQSDYDVTRRVLKTVVARGHPCVKSGLMVGLGETDDEVIETLDELRDAGVHIVTIGQYLRPTMKHWPVERYVDEETYARYIAHGERLGFTHIFAGPFVRSSYHAAEAMRAHDASPKAVSRAHKKPLPVLS
jgi:lipoic acid synthetase